MAEKPVKAGLSAKSKTIDKAPKVTTSRKLDIK